MLVGMRKLVNEWYISVYCDSESPFGEGDSFPIWIANNKSNPYYILALARAEKNIYAYIKSQIMLKRP